MYKLVVLVLAVAASAIAETQMMKSSIMGSSQMLPAGTSYISPVSGYATGYTASAVIPQYQQYAQYPHLSGYANYAGYTGYPAGYPAGYQGLVSPMPYAAVANVPSYPYGAQYVYQKAVAAPAPAAAAAYTVL